MTTSTSFAKHLPRAIPEAAATGPACPLCASEDLETYNDGEDRKLAASDLGSSRQNVAHGKILRCRACRFGFRQSRPAEDELSALYRDLDPKVYEKRITRPPNHSSASSEDRAALRYRWLPARCRLCFRSFPFPCRRCRMERSRSGTRGSPLRQGERNAPRPGRSLMSHSATGKTASVVFRRADSLGCAGACSRPAYVPETLRIASQAGRIRFRECPRPR